MGLDVQMWTVGNFTDEEVARLDQRVSDIDGRIVRTSEGNTNGATARARGTATGQAKRPHAARGPPKSRSAPGPSPPAGYLT